MDVLTPISLRFFLLDPGQAFSYIDQVHAYQSFQNKSTGSLLQILGKLAQNLEVYAHYSSHLALEFHGTGRFQKSDQSLNLHQTLASFISTRQRYSLQPKYRPQDCIVSGQEGLLVLCTRESRFHESMFQLGFQKLWQDQNQQSLGCHFDRLADFEVSSPYGQSSQSGNSLLHQLAGKGTILFGRELQYAYSKISIFLNHSLNIKKQGLISSRQGRKQLNQDYIKQLLPDYVRMWLQFFENRNLAHCCRRYSFIIILQLNFFKCNGFILHSIFGFEDNSISTFSYPLHSFIFFLFVHSQRLILNIKLYQQYCQFELLFNNIQAQELTTRILNYIQRSFKFYINNIIDGRLNIIIVFEQLSSYVFRMTTQLSPHFRMQKYLIRLFCILCLILNLYQLLHVFYFLMQLQIFTNFFGQIFSVNFYFILQLIVIKGYRTYSSLKNLINKKLIQSNKQICVINFKTVRLTLLVQDTYRQALHELLLDNSWLSLSDLIKIPMIIENFIAHLSQKIAPYTLNIMQLTFILKYYTYNNSKNFKQSKMMQGENFCYSSVSCFKQRPSENIRYLISRQLAKLVDISISQALQFVNTSQTKAKALKQLKYAVLIAEDKIAVHLVKIIKALVKIWQLEIENVEKTIKDIMAIIGFYVKSNYYLPLMMNILTQDEIKNSHKNIIILLKLISNMLLTSQDLQTHLQQIIKLVTTYQALLLENDEGLSTVSQIAMTLVHRLPNIQNGKLVSTIFSVLLNVESTKSIPIQFRKKVKQSMQVLAKKAGFNSVPELHSQQVGHVLSKIIKQKQYTTWNKSSKNRFKFDTIVRNCQGEAIKFLSQILTVLEFCISVDCDIQLRIDTLVLIQQMLNNEKIRQAMKQHANRVFLKILNVAIKWKVGHPQIKIRKAGLINMIRMIQLEVINDIQLLQCLSQILPNIKACLSDDWAPQVRLSACQFLQKFLFVTKQNIDGEQLKDLYVILLERLDDSQDPIRQKITKALNIFFRARYLPITISVSSIMQYMINAIFIHFDDNKQFIRDAINTSLRFAAQVDPQQVLKSARANLGKMKHPNQCKQLIQYCQNQIQEKKL